MYIVGDTNMTNSELFAYEHEYDDVYVAFKRQRSSSNASKNEDVDEDVCDDMTYNVHTNTLAKMLTQKGTSQRYDRILRRKKRVTGNVGKRMSASERVNERVCVCMLHMCANVCAWMKIYV